MGCRPDYQLHLIPICQDDDLMGVVVRPDGRPSERSAKVIRGHDRYHLLLLLLGGHAPGVHSSMWHALPLLSYPVAHCKTLHVRNISGPR